VANGFLSKCPYHCITITHWPVPPDEEANCLMEGKQTFSIVSSVPYLLIFAKDIFKIFLENE
jgi:hypothetical protein